MKLCRTSDELTFCSQQSIKNETTPFGYTIAGIHDNEAVFT